MSVTAAHLPARRFDRWGLQGDTIDIAALRGPIGSRERYVALVSLGFLVSEITPAEDEQGPIDAQRVREIAAGLLERPDDWVLAGIVASFAPRGAFITEDPDERMGVLRLPRATRFTIEDGRHRHAAIMQALREAPHLAQQTIAVELFPLEGRDRSAQLASALNHTMLAQDPGSRATIVAQAVMETVPVFATGFVTLPVLSDASGDLLAAMRSQSQGSPVGLADATAQVIAFWAALAGIIPQWGRLASGELTLADLRGGFVSGHAVVIRALALAGRSVIAEAATGMASMDRLAELGHVDWSRSNPDWQGVCIIGGRVVARRSTREATARLLEARLDRPSGAVMATVPDEQPLAGARLAALNMALTGMSRAETDMYLRENFDLDDSDILLDEVYATAGG